MNNIRQMDPLRGENWAGVYADVPKELNEGVQLAFARIRERERRRKRLVRMASIAACALLAVGACALGFRGREGVDSPDHVTTQVAEVTVLKGGDSVYASNGDGCFHVYASCPLAGETAVELPLVTALEFEKTLCATCGVNVRIEP